jgi:hypothetical protein
MMDVLYLTYLASLDRRQRLMLLHTLLDELRPQAVLAMDTVAMSNADRMERVKSGRLGRKRCSEQSSMCARHNLRAVAAPPGLAKPTHLAITGALTRSGQD